MQVKGIAANRWAWVSEANRPASEKNLDVFLREAAEAGYDAVEAADENLADSARRYGLEVCGTYVSGPLHRPWDELDVDRAILKPARAAAELGADYLVVNADPKGSWSRRERKSEDELKRQGENLSRLGEAVTPLGLRLLLHNHADSAPLHLDDLRSVTEFSAAVVGICLDTGWALVSGDDPVERVRALGPRLGGLHLRNHRGRVPTEWLGQGDLDVAAFVRALAETDYCHWLTTELWHREDASPRISLLEAQRRTVDLLRRLAGVAPRPAADGDDPRPARPA